MLIESVAEVVSLAVRVKSPICRRVRVEARAFAFVYAEAATRAGRAASGSRSCLKSRAVARNHQGIKVAEKPPVSRGLESRVDENIFEAGLEVRRAKLGGGSEKLILEMMGDRITLSENRFAMSFLVGFLILEVAKSRALARLRGVDLVRARGRERAVFQAVDERIEGATSRSLAKRKASHNSKAFFAAKMFSEFRNGREAEQRHKQEGTEHADGVNRRATSGRRAIERSKHWPDGVEVQRQEDQSGLKPKGIEATRMTLEPASQVDRGGLKSPVRDDMFIVW